MVVFESAPIRAARVGAPIGRLTGWRGAQVAAAGRISGPGAPAGERLMVVALQNPRPPRVNGAVLDDPLLAWAPSVTRFRGVAERGHPQHASRGVRACPSTPSWTLSLQKLPTEIRAKRPIRRHR